MWRAAVWAAGLAVCAAQNEEIVIDILPESYESDTPAQAVYNRLLDAVTVQNDGSSGADAFDSLKGIGPDGMVMTHELSDPHAAGVDIYSETGLKAVAGSNFELTAGGTLDARIQDSAEATVGALDLQSLASTSILSGDDAELAVDGDLGAVATGAVELDALSMESRVAGTLDLIAGGSATVATGGAATLDAASLDANVRGDISASGAALNLEGSKTLSVVAGEIDVQTPGSVRLAGNGAYAELDGSTDIEFETFLWKSSDTFDVFENTLPAEVSDVTEIVIRGTTGSAASIVAAAQTTITLQLGEMAGGAMTWRTVWTSKVGVGTYSADGQVIKLDRLYAISAMRLSSDAGDGKTFQGWSTVQIMLGKEVANGAVRVASASNLEATAADGVLLNAQTVQLNAASELDVSASDSASLLSDKVSVQASDSLEAAAGSLNMHVSDSINAFSGGDVSGSFGAVTAESRGDASLSAAGDVSIAGQSADLSLSGPLSADATELKIRTQEEASLHTATLSAVAAESASLHTTDASLSLSGQMSAFMNTGDILAMGDISVQSAGGLDVRNKDFSMESQAATLMSREMDAIVGNLKLHAQQEEPHHQVTVPLDCDAVTGGCESLGESSEFAMLHDLAEMLNVPHERLRVRVKGVGGVDGSGRRRMESAPANPFKQWTVDEVAAWIEDILGYENVAAGAARENVDGAMAIEMTRADWMELGASGMKAAKIITAVQREMIK